VLRWHRSALVRLHCAWAVGRLGIVSARPELVAALVLEPSAEVREELRLAIDSLDNSQSNKLD
jgi:hypothetical protein